MPRDDAPDGPADDSSSDGSEKRGASTLVKAGVLSGLGFELVGFTVGGILLGRYIDQQFGTDPLGFLVCLLGSLIAVGWHIWIVSERLLLKKNSTSNGSSDG